MNKKLIRLVCVAIGLFSLNASALDASGQRYTKMLASGGPNTVSEAAQDVYNSRTTDQEVFDVVAQVLSEYYTRNQNDRDYVDATSWLCKALGSSNNGRYRAFMKTVVDSHVHKRARKYCDNAMDNLPKGAAASFQPGTIDLAKYREGGAAQQAAAPVAAPAAKATKPSSSGKRTVDFSLVHEGMSMEEVDDVLGPPTNQTTYMTGKQFQPFNFGARDVQRTKYFYKGVGHIVFSLKSAYNGIYRVLEIVPDSNESGYP